MVVYSIARNTSVARSKMTVVHTFEDVGGYIQEHLQCGNEEDGGEDDEEFDEEDGGEDVVPACCYTSLLL